MCVSVCFFYKKFLPVYMLYRLERRIPLDLYTCGSMVNLQSKLHYAYSKTSPSRSVEKKKTNEKFFILFFFDIETKRPTHNFHFILICFVLLLVYDTSSHKDMCDREQQQRKKQKRILFTLTNWMIPHTDRIIPQSDNFGPQTCILLLFFFSMYSWWKTTKYVVAKILFFVSCNLLDELCSFCFLNYFFSSLLHLLFDHKIRLVLCVHCVYFFHLVSFHIKCLTQSCDRFFLWLDCSHCNDDERHLLSEISYRFYVKLVENKTNKISLN